MRRKTSLFPRQCVWFTYRAGWVLFLSFSPAHFLPYISLGNVGGVVAHQHINSNRLICYCGGIGRHLRLGFLNWAVGLETPFWIASNSGKLSLRQSRAKPAWERVETRWRAPKRKHGEGIVQTTTPIMKAAAATRSSKKIWWWQHRAGSSPASSTIETNVWHVSYGDGSIPFG